MNSTPQDPMRKTRRFKTLLLNAMLILPPAFLYSMKSDIPHIFTLTAVLLLISFFKRTYLPYKDRPVIYCATIALVLTIIPDLLVTVDDARYGLFDLMIRSSLAVPTLLYLAALSSLFPPDPRRVGLTTALALAATLICGDVFNFSNLSNNVLSFLDLPLRNYRTCYTAGAALQMLSIPFLFLGGSEKAPEAHNSARVAMTRNLLRWCCILLIPFFALSAARFYYANESFLRHIEFYFLRLGAKRERSGTDMMLLSSEVNLNATLTDQLRRSPGKVLIRARADAPPGYLRGGVYLTYQGGSWKTAEETEPMPATRQTSIVSDTTFTVADFPGAPPRNATGANAKSRQIDLFFDGLQTRGVIPAPGNTYELKAVADNGDVSRNGIFTLKQWKRDGGCTVFITAYDPEAAYPLPAPQEELLRTMTSVPEPLKNDLKPFISFVRRSAEGTKDIDKVKSLTAFLMQRCTYSFDYQPPQEADRDPVIHFLQNERKGHCELFASSAALILRGMGMPSRYVTGFLCEEKNPYSSYYLARAVNAHAWCEVYLPDEKRWILVEATPPTDLPSALTPYRQSSITSFFDLFKQAFDEAFADVRRGYFANAVLTFLENTWKLLPVILKNPFVLLIVLLLLFGISYRYWKLLLKKKKTGIKTPEGKRRLSLQFSSFEKRYAKITRRKRPPQETLQTFYRNEIPELRALIADYEELRYQAADAAPERIRSFARRSAQILALRKEMEKTSPPD